MTNQYQLLLQAFPDISFQRDVLLAPLTYFKIGGPADVFAELADREHIAGLVRWCHEHGLPLTILGGASNVVIADKGIRGVIIRMADDSFQVGQTQGDVTLLQVGSGSKTALLVRQTVDAGLTGLEFFLGVPGTVGGAVYNNAHYLRSLIGEYITRVEVMTPENEIRWLSKEECRFGYDSSRFQKSGEVILRVEFALPKGKREVSEAKIREATLYRAQTQPLGLPSSGCIFQNAPNTPELQKRFPQFADEPFVPGGFLIDQAGLKKTRQGDIEVSEKHAAFFINTGAGTAADIRLLIQKVKDTVREKFGAQLHEEVFWLGEKEG